MKKQKTNVHGAIRIEDPSFTRKENIVDGINLDNDSSGAISEKPKQIDSLPKKVSRHVAFVKASALQLAKEKEIVQFLVFGGIIFLLLLFAGFLLHVWQLKQDVEVKFTKGYELLLSAKDAVVAQSLDEATEMVEEARMYFEGMQHDLAALHFTSSSLLSVDGTVTTVSTLLDSVVELTEILGEAITLGQRALQILTDLKELSEEELVQKYQNMTEYIGYQFAELHDMRLRLGVIRDRVANMHLVFFPGELVERLQLLEEQLYRVDSMLGEIIGMETFIRSFLGDYFPKRYVILFQNADEMRPTGGFLGSMMFVSFNNGWITEQVFSDVYDIAGQVDVGIMAPPGLDTLTNRFGLQDANYFPDFQETAENILWFFDKGGAASVDGIITLNTTVIEDVLRLTGPIYFPVLGTEVEVNADNFTTVLSLLVEAKVDSSSPKVFLKEFIDVFQKEIVKVSPQELFVVLRSHVEQRNILAYHRDQDLMEELLKYDVAGSLYTPQEEEDFLRIVPTSISGNKSDKYIEQRVYHRTEMEGDGGVLVEVALERKHLWGDEQRAIVEGLARDLGVGLTPLLREILGAGTNRNYTRVYVPRGSSLVRASLGDEAITVDIFEENKTTVFAFTQETAVGTTSTVKLLYRLPFALEEGDKYSFVAEKSSGDRVYRLFKEVIWEGEQVLSFEGHLYNEGEVEVSEMLLDILRYEFKVVGK